MYQLMDCFDTPTSGIFYVTMVFSGSFFALQLLLAVLEENFIKSAFPKSRLKAVQEKMLIEREKNILRPEGTTIAFAPLIYSYCNSCYHSLHDVVTSFSSASSQFFRRRIRSENKQRDTILSKNSKNSENSGINTHADNNNNNNNNTDADADAEEAFIASIMPIELDPLFNDGNSEVFICFKTCSANMYSCIYSGLST